MLAAYVILTSPYGGEENDATPVRSRVAVDEMGAIEKLSPVASHAVVIEPHQLDADVRDLLDPTYSPHKGKNGR